MKRVVFDRTVQTTKTNPIVHIVNVHATNSNVAMANAFHESGSAMVRQLTFHYDIPRSNSFYSLDLLGDNDCSMHEDEQNCEARNCTDNEFRYVRIFNVD